MTAITVDLDPTGGRACLAELAARQELVDAHHQAEQWTTRPPGVDRDEFRRRYGR